jgi:Fe2+ or Zn2+ uptake regulation protein
MRSFFNTINATGQDLFSANERAVRQEDLVLRIFSEVQREMTPFEVDERLRRNGFNYPITSVRRSITNLTKSGKLEKTSIKRIGEYGQVNYTWRIK